MQRNLLTRTLLAAALAGVLTFGAVAQPDTRSTKERELDSARADLQKAARRVAELSRELGRPGEGAFVFEHRRLAKPVLGVVLDEDVARGVRISGVTPGSGAAKAGLRSGDRIVAIDGTTVAGATGAARLDRLRDMLGDLRDGKPIQLSYERDGRPAIASVTPQSAAPMTFFGGDGGETRPMGDVRIIRKVDGRVDVEADAVEYRLPPGTPMRIERRAGDGGQAQRRIITRDVRGGRDRDTHESMFEMGPGVAPEVHREVIRLARDASCRDGKNCRTVALSEAFRWNGLNLASVDARLGRYFGTDSGVLVVSAGPELAGLQSGDVIRRVEGQSVATPRDVMDRLRGKPDGATVPVEILRDRKTTIAQLKAPKAMRIPLPPPPPAPPAPAAPVSPPPPAPPAPPAAVVPANAEGPAVFMAVAPQAPLPPGRRAVRID